MIELFGLYLVIGIWLASNEGGILSYIGRAIFWPAYLGNQ